MKRAILKNPLTSSDTSALVTEFIDLAGVPLVQSDFGDIGYGTIAPNTMREEAVAFVVVSNPSGEATLTLTRGLLGKYPYGAGGVAYSHDAGEEFVISNNPDLLNQFTVKSNDETITGDYRFTHTPTHDDNPVTKEYLETNATLLTSNQTIGGVKTFSNSPKAPDASASDELATYGQTVHTTGDQTITGKKTFSGEVVVSDAVNNSNPLTKKQFDDAAQAYSSIATNTIRGTIKLHRASATPLDPKVLVPEDTLIDSESSGTPANNAGFIPRLESDGMLAPKFFARMPSMKFYTAGTYTWTKPSGLFYIRAKVQGSGVNNSSVDTTSFGSHLSATSNYISNNDDVGGYGSGGTINITGQSGVRGYGPAQGGTGVIGGYGTGVNATGSSDNVRGLGGGGYAEKFISASSLGSTETVTVKGNGVVIIEEYFS